jgi:PAS domain S-box-containing protein
MGRMGPARENTGVHPTRLKQVESDIYAEQVALLYAGARAAALANSVNAAILVLVLWDTTVHERLLWWLGAVMLVQGARLALAYLYETAPLYRALGLRTYIQADVGWDRAYLASVAAGGLLWGIAGAWLFPSQAIDHQLALIFVLGGTVAGATTVLAPVSWAFSLYALPALIPLGIRFFLEGTPHYMAMGALTFVFLVVLLNVANSIHKTIANSIALRLENKELVAALKTKASNLEQINRLLGTQITEHTAAQDEFRDKFLFLQQLIDAIPIPVFYKDMNGRYQGCNEALSRFLGIAKGDFIGKTVSDMVPPELAIEHTRKDRELAEHGGVQIYESLVRAADGTKRRILFHKTVYRDHLDRTVGIIGTLVDLTERKQAEEALTRRMHDDEKRHE